MTGGWVRSARLALLEQDQRERRAAEQQQTRKEEHMALIRGLDHAAGYLVGLLGAVGVVRTAGLRNRAGVVTGAGIGVIAGVASAAAVAGVTGISGVVGIAVVAVVAVVAGIAVVALVVIALILVSDSQGEGQFRIAGGGDLQLISTGLAEDGRAVGCRSQVNSAVGLDDGDRTAAGSGILRAVNGDGGNPLQVSGELLLVLQLQLMLLLLSLEG